MKIFDGGLEKTAQIFTSTECDSLVTSSLEGMLLRGQVRLESIHLRFALLSHFL